MNIASLATVTLYYSPWCKHASRVVAIGARHQRIDLAAFERMVRAWSWIERTEIRYLEDKPDLSDCADATIVILSETRPEGLNLPENAAVVLPTVPSPEDDHFGFFQEVESHDYELGGLNEWMESAKTSFSPYVLQSLSAAHVHRMLPGEAWADLEAQLRSIKPEGRISCLDVGCGPISKLRAAALSGLLEIVGVDPLNDLYSSVIARHGYDQLPCIRPDVAINGFAEEIDFGGRTFDFIFSLNALDHTQDLERSIASMLGVLSERGIAFIKVYTKEGERQNYAGLHKFNLWSDGSDVFFNTKDTAPASIRTISDRLQIGRVYAATDDELAFTLHCAAKPALAASGGGATPDVSGAREPAMEGWSRS